MLNSFLDLDASKLAFIPINQILTVFQVFKTIESVATIGFDPLFEKLRSSTDKFLFKWKKAFEEAVIEQRHIKCSCDILNENHHCLKCTVKSHAKISSVCPYDFLSKGIFHFL